MKKNSVNFFSVVLILIITIGFSACAQNKNQVENSKFLMKDSSDLVSSEKKFIVTFIELGSVKCIPCQQMQPVMKAIETKYSKDVKVVFHDVWTDAGKPYGVKYGIEAIPTQIFLDETGKEFYRHVGYFAEEELVKVLQQKGIKPV